MKIPIPTIKIVTQAINQFIFIMTLSDFLVASAFGLISPILAVYLVKQIENGSLEVVGIGSMIFFIMNALFKIPIAKIIDKNKAEWDDFYVTVAGYLLISSVPFFYILINKPIHLYLLQAAYGLGTATAYPGWMALFTRHIDKDKEGFSWSFYSTSTNIAAGISAALGGIIAQRVGFQFLFILVGCFSFLGTFCLFLNRGKIITKGHVPPVPRIEVK
jgi:MFS family permease